MGWINSIRATNDNVPDGGNCCCRRRDQQQGKEVIGSGYGKHILFYIGISIISDISNYILSYGK